ncbi:MAG: hypothetical protein E6333_05190 [Staphylococcus epidermidis]|nr:hypothetical protein [Staphylococcus epidermidis]
MNNLRSPTVKRRNDSTWNQIGLSAMYMIVTLPQEDRNVEYKTFIGEVKKPINTENNEKRIIIVLTNYVLNSMYGYYGDIVITDSLL